MKISRIVIGLLLFISMMCQPAFASQAEDLLPLDVGPAKECEWIYSKDGLDRFKNARIDAGFDPQFNTHITISRLGLTARVVGTLNDNFMAKFDNDMDKVVQQFPYLTPISQTSVHIGRRENRRVLPSRREQRGEVLQTRIIDLPRNSVMIVYPVSVADRKNGWNTLAGKWLVDGKTRVKPNNSRGRFGKFPFMLYTGNNGHALHGPITTRPEGDFWRLKRGEVSHGCNRMQGEHIVELAVLMGCGKDPNQRLCPDPNWQDQRDNEYVSVIEEFDIIPDPEKEHEVGLLGSWDSVLTSWFAVDVDFPRQVPVSNRYRATLGGKQGWFLKNTCDRETPRGEVRCIERTPRGEDDKNIPFAYIKKYPTWDNLEKELVVGRNC
ncbi:MAG: L,D-transpeptidase [Cyanobacteria bacterium P01_D01_bin.156]